MYHCHNQPSSDHQMNIKYKGSTLSPVFHPQLNFSISWQFLLIMIPQLREPFISKSKF
eukprot:UN18979